MSFEADGLASVVSWIIEYRPEQRHDSKVAIFRAKLFLVPLPSAWKPLKIVLVVVALCVPVGSQKSLPSFPPSTALGVESTISATKSITYYLAREFVGHMVTMIFFG